MSPRGQPAMGFGVPPLTRGVKWLGGVTLATLIGRAVHIVVHVSRMQDGKRRLTGISEITDRFVELNKAETAEPNARNAAVYRDLQGLQDEMSLALRGAFAKHRQFLLR